MALKPTKHFYVTGGDSKLEGKSRGRLAKSSVAAFTKALEPLIEVQKQVNDRLQAMQGQLTLVHRRINNSEDESLLPSTRDLFLIAVIILIQLLLFWLFRK